MLNKLKMLFTTPSTTGSGIASISPADAEGKLAQPGVVMIDVREPDEFRSGHVQGAKLMPLGTVPSRWQELSGYQEVIVVCRSGNRSMAACRQLNALGIAQVSNLSGGMMAWAHAKLPIQR